MNKGFLVELDEAFDCFMAVLGLKKADPLDKANPLDNGKTFLGPSCGFEGKIKCTDRTTIDGAVISGNILINNDLTIGEKGKIFSGSIKANNISIAGNVHGNTIVAHGLELKRTARLEGNISVHFFSAERGAIFEGYCSMIKRDEPEIALAPFHVVIAEVREESKVIS
jgi:cytoskeletal protein CcmA (bactofilin family)